MKKRILSILLTLCMVVGLVSTAVFAEDNMAASATATKEITKADTVTKKLPDNGNPPPTGGRSSLALWMALLFVSGGAVIGAKAGDRKRKSNG